ncbi:MAG: diguanylate cyclase, partial [Nitrospira sp.]|nr:diguanylate cyclase [Nitrospira sp.]
MHDSTQEAGGPDGVREGRVAHYLAREEEGGFVSTDDSNRRVLVVDDNLSIHNDFRRIFQPESEPKDLAEARVALFGEFPSIDPHEPFEVDCVDQGRTALALVEAANKVGRPYAVAFVDMRMPPGWDGLETVEHLWKVDSTLQVVICSAYSDQPWEEIRDRIGRTDKLLILQKPFNSIEVLQQATALCRKWDLANKAVGRLNELSHLVDERTVDLQQANRQLTEMNGALMRTVADLEAAQAEIMRQNDELEHLASRDPLTGCLNRRAFYALFERAFAESRDQGSELCCLMVDIDHFKRVNDRYGH